MGMFADAADGKLDDPNLAERVNRWLPSNLRDDPPADPPTSVGRKDAA